MEEINLLDDGSFNMRAFGNDVGGRQYTNDSGRRYTREQNPPSLPLADLIDLDLDGKSVIRQFDPLATTSKIIPLTKQHEFDSGNVWLPSSSISRNSVSKTSDTPTAATDHQVPEEDFIPLSSCRSSFDAAATARLLGGSDYLSNEELPSERLKVSQVKSENDAVKSFRSMVLRIHREMTLGPFPELLGGGGGDEELPAPSGHCGLIAATMAPAHVSFAFTDSIRVYVYKTEHVPCGAAFDKNNNIPTSQQHPACVDFECSITSSPEIIVTQALFEFCGDEVASKFNSKEFVLRIRDTMECLYCPVVPTELLSLASFEHTWLCLRAKKNLEYYLESRVELGKDLMRTREDVGRPFVTDDLAKRLNAPSMQDAEILVDTFETEMSKLMDMFPSRLQLTRRSTSATSKYGLLQKPRIKLLCMQLFKETEKAWSILGADERQKLINQQVRSVYQAVRAICMKHRNLEPNRVTDAIEQLMSCTTLTSQAAAAPLDGEEAQEKRKLVLFALRELRHAVARLIKLFTTTFRSTFSINEPAHRPPSSTSSLQQQQDPDYGSSSGGVGVVLCQIETTRLIGEAPRIEVECIHNVPPEYSMEYGRSDGSSYVLLVGLQYGYETLAPAISFESKEGGDTSAPDRISFNESFTFQSESSGLSIAQLPRETKFTICLFGLKPETLPSTQHTSSSHHPTAKATATVFYQCQRLLGWASLSLFDVNGVMRQGDVLLCLHRNCEFRGEGPEVSCSNDPDAPIVLLHLPEYAGQEVIFPKVLTTLGGHSLTTTTMPSFSYQNKRNFNNRFDSDSGVVPCSSQYDFDQLDENTKQQLDDIMEKDVLSKLTQAELDLVWGKRHYLRQKWVSGQQRVVLPRILQAARSWSWNALREIYALLDDWGRQVDYIIEPINALQLLCSYDYPDHEVHVFAVKCLERSIVCRVAASDDRLENYMMQLVTALRFESYDSSPLAKFLLESAMKSILTAHTLFWTLKQYVNDKLMGQRYRLMLNALLTLCGRGMRANFSSQENLARSLAYVAEQVKRIKDPNQRADRLKSSLGLTNELFKRSAAQNAAVQQPSSSSSSSTMPFAAAAHSKGITLPLDARQRVVRVDVNRSYYFNSTSIPLKLSFVNYDSSEVNVIFKVGDDDLRQDQIAIQMIRAMDRAWKDDAHQLDLNICTFSVLPTDYKKGLIEMVEDAETLRKIQTVDTGHGAAGSFRNTPLVEWLRRHNPLDPEYSLAVERFSRSCAGYCVATYILGICDRHNDNIMVRPDGRMFHIDFGKYMGDAQMTLGGTVRRDRVPFVLTPDMAYVINDGERPTVKFQEFVDLCCMAFNIIRQRSNELLVLFSAMSESDIPGVTGDYAVRYIQKALMPDASDAQATAHFTRMIEDSLKSWFTQFNFFVHNLSQMRFLSTGTADTPIISGEAGDADASSSTAALAGQLFSFRKEIVAADTRNRITNIDCFGYQKRYDPDKLYVFVIRVYRVGIKAVEPDFVFRTFKELQELSNKLVLVYPHAAAKMHPLNNSVRMGRTNVKQVAERRKSEVDLFLASLMQQPDAVAHNDIVYTFFHRLPRDVRFEHATGTIVSGFSSSTTPLAGISHAARASLGSLSGDSGSELGGGGSAVVLNNNNFSRNSVDFSCNINKTNSSFVGGRPLSLDAEQLNNKTNDAAGDAALSSTTASSSASSLIRTGSSLALFGRARRCDSDAATMNNNNNDSSAAFSTEGEIKLSIDYRDDSLHVMLNHCKDLALPNGEPPDSYVKCYLVPDTMRTTKRKTKVVRKSHHPTFNEQLVYHLPLQTIKYCILSVTVWHYDRFKENQALGTINIPLESIFSNSNNSNNNKKSAGSISNNASFMIRRAQSQSEFAADHRRRSSSISSAAVAAATAVRGEAKWYLLKPVHGKP